MYNEVMVPFILENKQSFKVFKGLYRWVLFLFVIGLLLLGTWAVKTTLPKTVQATGVILKNTTYQTIIAEQVGTISEVRAAVGDTVSKGQIIATLTQQKQENSLSDKEQELKAYVDEYYAIYKQKTARAQKRIAFLEQTIIALKEEVKEGGITTHTEEIHLTAPIDGKLLRLSLTKGAQVSEHMPLYTIESGAGVNAPVTGYLFMTQLEAQHLTPSLTTSLSPAGFPSHKYGYLKGQISSIETTPLTRDQLRTYFQDDTAIESLIESGKTILVKVDLTRNSDAPTGYAWSIGDGPSVSLFSGTPVKAAITLENITPAQLVLPKLALLSPQP